MAILLVEDDDTRVERFRFELDGQEIDHVDSVDKAIELLKEKTYDLVFLDHDLEFGDRAFTGKLELATFEMETQESRRISTSQNVDKFNWAWSPND